MLECIYGAEDASAMEVPWCGCCGTTPAPATTWCGLFPVFNQKQISNHLVWPARICQFTWCGPIPSAFEAALSIATVFIGVGRAFFVWLGLGLVLWVYGQVVLWVHG